LMRLEDQKRLGTTSSTSPSLVNDRMWTYIGRWVVRLNRAGSATPFE
jgi:hypothetical protein